MRQAHYLLAAMLSLASAGVARADVVTDWNAKAGELVVESRLGTPPAVRAMAIVQTAVLDAVETAGRAGSRASVEAAVAAANRAALVQLLPNQASIATAYQAALASVADGPAKLAGITIGEQAAAKVLVGRADDGGAAGDTYRPHGAAGAYVPTAIPAAAQWPARRPWLMASPAQFRPAPPPTLTSERWVRDYQEVKAFGARSGSRRSAEQTEVARFWEFSLPSIYHGVVRSVAERPGRDVAANARLFAAVAQASDDALIAVFDAKYHYHFWRPLTAIRNGDADGHPATERDAAWAPLIDTPLHPEYPSAHAILAAATGAVIQAELGGSAGSPLATTSPSAKGATRRWNSVDEFVQEVVQARVWEGVHFRFSTEVGAAMGRQIGELAARRFAEGQL